MINRAKQETEEAVGEERFGFRKDRGCVDQIFILRQFCENFLAKGKEV